MTRGCGELAHDALYHYWPLGNRGMPINWFLLCPVWIVDREKLGISYQGITILPRMDLSGQQEVDQASGKAIYDAWDVVGRKHYPYKTDFYEEGRLQGFSRRWPTSIDTSLLLPGISLHYLCTDAGGYQIDDAEEIRTRVDDDHINGPFCRKYPGLNMQGHKVPYGDRYFEACSALWYYEQAEGDCTQVISQWMRVTKSTVPSTGLKMGYTVHPRKTEPKWLFGAFMALPIGQFMATTPRGSDTLSDRVFNAAKKITQMGVNVIKVQLNPYMPGNEEEEE